MSSARIVGWSSCKFKSFHGLLFAAGLALLLAACSRPPSKGDIMNSIVEAQSQGGDQVQSVEIIQMGKYNAQMKYWSVKARVKGRSRLPYMNASGYKDLGPLNKEAVFGIAQDDFGKWKAEQIQSW